MVIKDLRLREAMPADSPHILIWDRPSDIGLRQLVYREDGQCISYRLHLLDRIAGGESKFLSLHLWLDREIESIKNICATSTKQLVILQDLDTLITYLSSGRKDFVSSLWQALSTMRHLESILWILLPGSLVPDNWPEKRSKRI